MSRFAIFVALSLTAGVASAQFAIPQTCTTLAGTSSTPAGYTGTVTFENLTKYGISAQVCTEGTFSGSSATLKFTYAGAIRQAKVQGPACGGLTWMNDGGPVYFYGVGSAAAALTDLSNPNVSYKGEMYVQAENLTVTVNGTNYQVSTELLKYRFEGNAKGQTLYVPKAGSIFQVNNQPLQLNYQYIQCLLPTMKVVEE